uniref:F-box domain-containing protein n=1 Tax=Plectus sambesii TaxID=2011161 RepID=A0A914V5P8_9BILA
MSMAALETEVTNQAEIDRLRRALGDFSERIVCGQLTGKLPDNFLEQFSQLPDRPLEQVLRFLPARQVAQMRRVSRKFNNLIKKCSKTMPKKESKGSVVFKSCNTGELSVELRDCDNKIVKTTLADDGVALSELFRFVRIGGMIYFGEGLSAADKVLNQLSMAWLTIRPLVVVFAGDLSKTSRDSLRAFLVKVEPSVKWLHFQYANNIGNSLLSDEIIGAAGRLKGLMVMPMCLGSKLSDINISDRTLLAMADADRMFSYVSVAGCSGITPGGIRAFIEKWMKKERPKPRGKTSRFRRDEQPYEMTFYKCANVTPSAVEKACGDLLKNGTMKAVPCASSFGKSGERNGQRVTFTVHCQSDDRRLRIRFHIASYLDHIVFEPRPFCVINDQIFFPEDDVHELARRRRHSKPKSPVFMLKTISYGARSLTYQFSHLPDQPLEQILRFLPALQVAQMRLVSHRFNQLIRKCSRTMPKKEHYGSILFKSNDAGQLTVVFFDDGGSKIIETMLTGNKVALSELLRLVCFDGLMCFSDGLSAADEVLDQLSKAWLIIRPEVVVFAGDFSQTSQDSLRAFFKKVEPSIRRLHFQGANNIDRDLLSDDVIGAAGQLEGLMVVPMRWEEELLDNNVISDINIGDNTLLSMADTDQTRSYCCLMGCSDITPGGIHAFVEKWMKKWRNPGKPKAGAKSTVERLRSDRSLFELTLYKCANVTQAAVEAACGAFCKKEWIPKVDRRDGEKKYKIYIAVQCRSSNRRLEINFNTELLRPHYVNEPRPDVALDDLIDDDCYSDIDDDDGDFYDDGDDMNYPEELIYFLIALFFFQSMAALDTEVDRLQAENDRLRRTLADFNERIMCGRLTGDLPDNFLELFSQLPDRPLEQVLRFLPPGQVAQMRRVSRRFNYVIRKGSKAMPKKECNGSVVFKSCSAEEITVAWIDDDRKKITKTMISLADDGVALSELFRFMRIGDRMYFGEGLSATDKVLDQLSKAWLTILPDMVIFAGDFSQTSRNSLRAFLVKVEPSVEQLHFLQPLNIPRNLLNDDVIAAAGRLNGLIVLPKFLGSELRDINIGDRTLLAMVDADHMSSYVSVAGCSGITPGGIRAFVEVYCLNAALSFR